MGGTVDLSAVEIGVLPIPDSFVVDIATDEVDGNTSPGDLSLREAIIAANADPNASTITFAAALNGTRIALTIAGSTDDMAATGDLDVTTDITITGNGPTNTIIDANVTTALNDRVLHVLSGGDLKLNNLQVTGGRPPGGGPGGTSRGGGLKIESGGSATITGSNIDDNFATSFGGGIHNSGTLVLTNSSLSKNQAVTHSGGGLFNQGMATITGSTIAENTGTGGILNSSLGGILIITDSVLRDNVTATRGGLFNFGAATITNSTIFGNRVTGDNGGGILNSGTLAVIGATISNNMANQRGGGISNSGSLVVTNSTISGNTSDTDGGAIWSSNSPVITNSTLTNNTADNGGGIFSTGTATINNSIIVGNTATTASPDVNGAFTSNGANVIGDATGGSGIAGTDITGMAANTVLSPSLADNGGSTLTHALILGSPAIDNGNNANATEDGTVGGTMLTTDQRGTGFPRIVNTNVDIGAFEFPIPDSFVVDITADVVNGNISPGDVSLREAVIAANANSNHSTITFAPALNGAPLVLSIGGTNEDAAATGDLDITTPVTIQGNGAMKTFINAGGTNGLKDRVLDVRGAGNLTLNSVSVTGGNSSTQGQGGGIRIVSGTTISNNTISSLSYSQGGGILNSGAPGKLTLINSTVSGNDGDTNGGGVVNLSEATISNSTFFENTAGGIFTGSGRTTTLNDTIVVAGSVNGRDLSLSGTYVGTNNLIEDGAGPGLTNPVTGNPMLGPLQNNGGQTNTHALLTGSVAIDAGSNTNSTLDGMVGSTALITDQRGTLFARIGNSTVDLGAFEVQDPDSFVVDIATDEVDGNMSPGDVSLREAIIAANTNSNPTTITFAAGLNGTPILLSITGTEDNTAAAGDLDITSDVTIQGNGVANTIISGGAALGDLGGTPGIAERVLHVLDDGNLTLRSATVRGGNAANFRTAGGINIESGGTANIGASFITGNFGDDGAGGIGSRGTLVVTDSTISGNRTTFEGAGIRAIAGTLTVTNSTISGNIADSRPGGGIFTRAATKITNSTIVNNTATSNAGIHIFSIGTVSLNNSIVAGHTVGDLSNVAAMTGTNNLVQDGATGSTGLTNTVTGDPLLGPLHDNGGPTETHALGTGSPAINAGSNANANATVDGMVGSTALATDQHGTGFDRIINTTVDIGAFELKPAETEVKLVGDAGLTITDVNGGTSNDFLIMQFDGTKYTIQDVFGLTIDASSVTGATGSGTKIVTVPAGSIDGFNVSTLAGNDRLIFSAAAAISFTGGVTIDGGTGADNMSFSGTMVDVGDAGLTITATQSASLGGSITTNNGNISVSGNAAGTAPGAAIGVSLTGTIQMTGTGDLLVTGKGGSSGGTDVFLASTVISSTATGTNAGTITINGTGGPGVDENLGVYMSGGGSITSVDGDIMVTGQGGAASGRGNRGILMDAGRVASTGTGPNAATITLSGTAGTGGLDMSGLRISGLFTKVRSADGNITITGTGNASDPTSTFSNGVALVNGATVETETAQIQIMGSTPAGNSPAVRFVQGLAQSTGSGSIEITGTSAGPAADVQIESSSIVGGSTASGPITINADSIVVLEFFNVLLFTPEFQSTGDLTIQTRTAGTTIGIGGGAGTLNLDDDELSYLLDGFNSITIGDTAAGTGTVDIDTATFTDPITIAAGTINDAAGTDIDAGTNAVTLIGNVAPGQSPGILTVSGKFAFGTGSTFEAEIMGPLRGRTTIRSRSSVPSTLTMPH